MFGLFVGRRRWFMPVIFLFVTLYYLLPDGTYVPEQFRGKHTIKAHEFPNIEASPRDKNGFLTTPIADPYCKAHNFDLFTPRTTRRKVYDLFLVNTELDWLEIRLNELKDHVDYFVIVESKHTFAGTDKPLHVKENWSRFSEFHNKIILRVLDDTALEGTQIKDHEDLQRNALFDQVLSPSIESTWASPALSSKQTPQQDDVILVSDIDEIPKPNTLTILRNCAFPARLTLRSAFYYYSFQWLHRGEQWPHPQATVYRGNETIRPADLRNGEGHYGGRNALTLQLDKADFWNSSWHCSTCFGTIEETITKMDSLSAPGWNDPAFHSRYHIVNSFRNGLDLFNRPKEINDKIEGRNWDIPRYLVEVQEKSEKGWSWLWPSKLTDKLKGTKSTKGGEALKGGRLEYLLNRDPENANFKDYSLIEAASDASEAENAKGRLPATGGTNDQPVAAGGPGGEGVSPDDIHILGEEEAAVEAAAKADEEHKDNKT